MCSRKAIAHTLHNENEFLYLGTMLPPITSAYKRKYEDEEEYDSEMDDFIDDGGDEQEEISRHIKEIFGYDRSK